MGLFSVVIFSHPPSGRPSADYHRQREAGAACFSSSGLSARHHMLNCWYQTPAPDSNLAREPSVVSSSLKLGSLRFSVIGSYGISVRTAATVIGIVSASTSSHASNSDADLLGAAYSPTANFSSAPSSAHCRHRFWLRASCCPSTCNHGYSRPFRASSCPARDRHGRRRADRRSPVRQARAARAEPRRPIDAHDNHVAALWRFSATTRGSST